MIEIKANGKVDARALYKFLESKQKFANWIHNLIRDFDFKENKDFIIILLKSTGGRPGKEYDLTIEMAKEVSMLARNDKGKQARLYFISIQEQKQNLDLLNHEQIIGLSTLIGFFKYVDNQKEIETKHKNKFAENSFKKYPFAEFHKYRNEALEIEPLMIDQKIKEYCILNSKALPNLKNKHAKIQFLDMYKNLRNAVWDFMEIKGQINSLKLADLAEKMAKAGNLELFNKNEDNLFQSKESLKSIT